MNLEMNLSRKEDGKVIEKFSGDVCEKIGYYVYRLIDPRNGQTFYVGKGKGDRVFDHVKEGKSGKKTEKCEIIREIYQQRLEVIHVIHRWNLTEEEAFQVESALIDAYPGLSNIQQGHDCDYGVTNVEVLQKSLGAEVYVEPDDFKYIIIKVNNWSMEQQFENNVEDARYEATRKWWKLNINRTQDYHYVFSVSYGIVKAVYEIEGWESSSDTSRIAFYGRDVSEEIGKPFIDKRIPEDYRKKGNASPCLFSKNTLKK